MRSKFLLVLTLFLITAFAQPATDVYLFGLKAVDNLLTVSNPVNISNNRGYDNQPSFTKNGM